MKTLLTLLVSACFVLADESGDQKAVRSAVDSFNAAAKAGDEAGLNKLLGDGLIYAHSNAKIENKAECVAALVKSKPNFALDSGATVQVYGKSAVFHSKMTAGQNRLDMIQVWVKNGSAWQMVARHTARLP
ncbi:MAG: nuclear transport factor 2 family protein [Acidobacteria bacterium]|nr:nuclear transport factor 2 family protein [Acidobacteriota bacterium]